MRSWQTMPQLQDKTTADTATCTCLQCTIFVPVIPAVIRSEVPISIFLPVGERRRQQEQIVAPPHILAGNRLACI